METNQTPSPKPPEELFWNWVNIARAQNEVKTLESLVNQAIDWAWQQANAKGDMAETKFKATPEQWERLKRRVRLNALEDEDAPFLLELRARVEALEAAQQQEQDPDGNREDQFRCALLWVLWHHQGGSSPIGQPLRRFLGLGPHDRMNPAWVQLAQRWGEDYASSSALPETEAQAAPAGSLVERVVDAMDEHVGVNRYAESRAAIREVAAAGHDANPFNDVSEPGEHQGWLAAFTWLEQEVNRSFSQEV